MHLRIAVDSYEVYFMYIAEIYQQVVSSLILI